MGPQDSAGVEENLYSNLNEVQREIPFDAAANHCWAKPTMKKKSGS
jgi:hypothetical protein